MPAAFPRARREAYDTVTAAGVASRRVRRLIGRVLGNTPGRGVADLQGRQAIDDFTPENLYVVGDYHGRALRNPPMVPAASLALPADEWILGAVRSDDARAYPLSILSHAHLVNDVIAGEPFLATYCNQCVSGLGFEPTVDGRSLSFDLYGIYRGNAVMIDDQTGTLWSQLEAEALVGELHGKRLIMEPVYVTTFGEWLDRYPKSLGLRPDPSSGRPARSWAGEAPRGFQAGASRPEIVRRSVPRWDDRLDADAFVLGVEIAGTARAYVLDPRRPGPALHQDVVAGVPVALLAPPGTWPLVYDRRTDRGVVELSAADGVVVDRDGSTWTGDGVATAGPAKGTRLRFVPSRQTKWFAWASAFPATDIERLA